MRYESLKGIFTSHASKYFCYSASGKRNLSAFRLSHFTIISILVERSILIICRWQPTVGRNWWEWIHFWIGRAMIFGIIWKFTTYLIAACTMLGKRFFEEFSEHCWDKPNWNFHFRVCSYTSLGDKINTVPNPHLKYFNEATGKDDYYPAYHLKNADAYERAGRLTSSLQNGRWFSVFKFLFPFLDYIFSYRIPNIKFINTICYLTVWWAGFLFWWWFDRNAKWPLGHLFA